MDKIVSTSAALGLIGGGPIDKTLISQIDTLVDGFVAVDGGADHLLACGKVPLAVIGDMDSISPPARATFAGQLHPVVEQDTTDVEKALSRVQAAVIIALGFTGGRMDHTLAVLNLLARLRRPSVLLVDAADVSLVPGDRILQLDLPAQTRVSVMPLGAARVSVTGLLWEFADQLMTPDGFTSPSNAASGGRVTVSADGPVLVTVPQAHLRAVLQAVSHAE